LFILIGQVLGLLFWRLLSFWRDYGIRAFVQKTSDKEKYNSQLVRQFQYI